MSADAHDEPAMGAAHGVNPMSEEPKGADQAIRGPHRFEASDASDAARTSLLAAHAAAAGEEPVSFEPIRPKRVLFFGKRKSRSVCTGALVDALRAQGLEVKWVNCSTLKRWLTKVPMRLVVRLLHRLYKPDLVFVFFHDLPKVLMQEISALTPTVVWMEERLQQVTPQNVAFVQNCRLLCLSTPELVETYRAAGVPQTTFLMSGFSPSYHHPHSSLRDGRKPKFDRDIAFIGGPGNIEDRPGFLAWLSQKHDLEIFGVKEDWLPYLKKYPELRFAGEARPRRYSEICARSKIIFGLNQTHDSWLYFSNRVFLTLACQGFHLMHYVPGMETVFEDGKHIAWFEDREECLEKINYYLEHEQERLAIAKSGHDLVHAEHRYEQRIHEILEILSGEKDAQCPQPDAPAELNVFRLAAKDLKVVPLPRQAACVAETRGRAALGGGQDSRALYAQERRGKSS